MLTLEDFYLTGTLKHEKKRRYKRTGDNNNKGTFYEPHVPSKHFEFHFRIYKLVGSMSFGIGNGKQKINDELGNDEHGFSLNCGGFRFNRSFGSKLTDTSLKFEQGDLLRFRVNRNLKRIVGCKNKQEKWITLFDFQKEKKEMPEKIYIAGSGYYDEEEFELVHYKDLTINLEMMMQDLNERIDFLRNEHDLFVFGEEKSRILVDLKLPEMRFENVMRILFLLK